LSLINIGKTIALDVYDHNTTPSVIKAIQLDTGTRNVSAVIQNSGQAYDIGQNAAVVLTVQRPDKTKVQITGQTFSYTGYGSDATAYGAKADLSDVALAIKGDLKAQFKITSGAQELRTEIFTINNGEALDAGDGDWAGEYQGYNLDELVATVNEVSEAAQGVIGMTVSSQTLPQGASATVTKTEDEDGIINLDFGLPLASGEVQVVNVSGANPTITAEYNKRYVCGEVATLTITPATQGCTDVLFTSGTTPTVLNLPQTVKMPSWFTVEANKTYEISILDGVYGAVMSWT